MRTREVHEAVKAFFGNYDYPLLNTFVFAWEIVQISAYFRNLIFFSSQYGVREG